MVWVLTPLLLVIGVPVEYVGLGWTLNLALTWLDNYAAKRYSDRLSPSTIMLIGIITIAVGMSALSWQLNLWTVGFYGVVGLARGWFGSTVIADVIHHSAADIKTTVMSIADSASRLVYMPTVTVIVGLGEHDLRNSMQAILVIFMPLMMLTWYKLRQYERK